MNITVIPAAKDINESKIKDKIVLVIDVLRATSTIATALDNGAKKIIPVLNVQEAIDYKKSNPNYKIGGERNGIKQPGFDFGNSPLEYKEKIVKNETIVITTTNGTRAINHCKSAKKIILLSFLNLNSVNKIVQFEEDIVIICAGTNNLFSIDDGVCAGALIYNLRKNNNCKLGDMGLACLTLYENTRDNLHNLISKCHHYKVLENIGCQFDLEYCLKENTLNIVPIYKDGYFIKNEI